MAGVEVILTPSGRLFQMLVTKTSWPPPHIYFWLWTFHKGHTLNFSESKMVHNMHEHVVVGIIYSPVCNAFIMLYHNSFRFLKLIILSHVIFFFFFFNKKKSVSTLCLIWSRLWFGRDLLNTSDQSHKAKYWLRNSYLAARMLISKKSCVDMGSSKFESLVNYQTVIAHIHLCVAYSTGVAGKDVQWRGSSS